MGEGKKEPRKDESAITLHASCVAVKGRAALILGASGRGKSALALQLMAFGADLVADDRTLITREGDVLWATAPKALSGMIEARSVGLLNARPITTAKVHVIIDMDVMETDRLPLPHSRVIGGVSCECLHKVDSPYFPAAVLQYLREGRRDP